MVSTVIPVQPFDLVIFGATGDLAHRKILPSLYRRLAVHQMPDGARGSSARPAQDDPRRVPQADVREALSEFVDAEAAEARARRASSSTASTT